MAGGSCGGWTSIHCQHSADFPLWFSLHLPHQEEGALEGGGGDRCSWGAGQRGSREVITAKAQSPESEVGGS